MIPRYSLPLALVVSIFLAAAALAQTPEPEVSQPPPSAVPSPKEEALFRFAAYGDTRNQHPIHRKIVQEVLSFHPALVLQTGDLVELGKLKAQWDTFDDIIKPLRAQVPYYPARGNHDGKKYFEKEVTQPVLSGNKLYYSFEKGNVHFVAIDTEQSSLDKSSKEGKWLEADFAKADKEKKFIIPFFHKAIFSVGHHAGDTGLELILRPLFEKYHVKLVFQGHDHIYYRAVHNGITYVVTGGGGAPPHDDDHLELRVPNDVYEKVYHFCIADVYNESVEVVAYRKDGLTEIDRFKVPME